MDYKEICITNAMKAKELAEEIVEKGDNYVIAKKLTLMAQSLDPGLKGISQLLDVVDVYIYYYERKIGNEPDYYSMLGVDPSVDDETMRRHYRKRALSLHPDKNKCVGAAGAFSLVGDALEFLSNKTKRFHYDINWLNSRIEKEIKLGESSLSSPSNGVNTSTNNDNNANPMDQNSATPPPDQPPPPPTDQPAPPPPPPPPPPPAQPAAPPSHQPTSPPNQPDPTPHQPATPPDYHPAPSPDQPAPPPPDQPAPRSTNSSPLRADAQSRETEPSHAPSSSKSSKLSTDERSGTDSMPAPTPDDNQPKSSRFWTICYACKMQYEYLRVYLRRKLQCPHCRNPFIAVETSAPHTDGAPFRRNSNVQHSTSSSGQPTRSRNSNVAAEGTTNKKRKERNPANINVYRRRAKTRPSKAEEEK